MNRIHKIIGKLKEIEYSPQIVSDLESYSLSALKSGRGNFGCCLIKNADDVIAFSEWVSPKRTRTYPLARVYDTLQYKNRVTLIPFCKDEGRDGDHDFLAWDTVALMSLLNVHVIIGWYADAKTKLVTKFMIMNM